jgi:predicted nucleotidyltransferase
MRLNSQQIAMIAQTLRQHFGEQSLILLFGSRVRDDARGGDIDLYVEPELDEPDQIADARIDALVQLKQLLGEQKIDLVIKRQQAAMLPIHEIAKQTGVRL